MNLPLAPDCLRFDELCSHSLDTPLAAAEQAEVDGHLARCPSCVDRMRGYVATIAALHEIGERERTETPPPIPESLVQRILAARKAAASAPTTERRIG
jgi:anti-sigma factor RsiW